MLNLVSLNKMVSMLMVMDRVGDDVFIIFFDRINFELELVFIVLRF